jgi:enterochelin esterase-like enzyme
VTIKSRIASITLLATAAAAFPGRGDDASRAAPALAAPAPVTYRSGIIAPGRGTWLSRLRVPVTFALLSMSNRRRLKMEPFEKVKLLPGQIEVTHVSETSHLSVERLRFWSDRMQQPRFLLVLVPKGPLHATEAFILNHGWFDRPEYMLQYLNVDGVYDEALQRSEVRPAVLVIPDVRFESIYRLRSDPTPPYLELEAEEIPAIISKRYGIPLEREHWAIGGFSFGGYLSLDIGRRYPGRFASVSVVSGFFDPKWTFWPTSSTRSFDTGESASGAVVPGPVPRLLLACGTNDWLFATMRSLDSGLEGMGIPAEWITAPGGHTWKYWSGVVRSMLLFHLGRDSGINPTRPALN